MSHIIIIRGGAYGEGTPPPEGTGQAEVIWAPPHDMTVDEEAELFKAQLKRYKKAVALDVG